jgi:hypothetical protein
MLCVDALSAIDADPVGWWKEVKSRIPGRGGVQHFGFGPHANGFAVVSTEHSSVVSIIAVGGNTAEVLGVFSDVNPHTPEGRLEIYKRLCEELGYKPHSQTKTELRSLWMRLRRQRPSTRYLGFLIEFVHNRIKRSHDDE